MDAFAFVMVFSSSTFCVRSFAANRPCLAFFRASASSVSSVATRPLICILITTLLCATQARRKLRLDLCLIVLLKRCVLAAFFQQQRLYLPQRPAASLDRWSTVDKKLALGDALEVRFIAVAAGHSKTNYIVGTS
eukprot:3974743-Pleurochrysis_carterae.AAC.1